MPHGFRLSLRAVLQLRPSRSCQSVPDVAAGRPIGERSTSLIACQAASRDVSTATAGDTRHSSPGTRPRKTPFEGGVGLSPIEKSGGRGSSSNSSLRGCIRMAPACSPSVGRSEPSVENRRSTEANKRWYPHSSSSLNGAFSAIEPKLTPNPYRQAAEVRRRPNSPVRGFSSAPPRSP